MNCLHCGKKLPLLRKFNGGEFCSDEHRSAYSKEADRLALRRLIETPGGSLRSVKPAPKRKGFKETLEQRNQVPPEALYLFPLEATSVGQPGTNILLGSIAELEMMGRTLALGYFRGAKPRARLWLPVSAAAAEHGLQARVFEAEQFNGDEPFPLVNQMLNHPRQLAAVDAIDWNAWSGELAETARRNEAGPPSAGLAALDQALFQAPSLTRDSIGQAAPLAGEFALAGAAIPHLSLRTTSPEASALTGVEHSRQRRLRPTAPAPKSEPPMAWLLKPAGVNVRAGNMDGRLQLKELPTVLGRRPAWPAPLGLRAAGCGMPKGGPLPLLAFGRVGGEFPVRSEVSGEAVIAARPRRPVLGQSTGWLAGGRDVEIPLPSAAGLRVPVEVVDAEPITPGQLLEAPRSVALRKPVLDPPLSTLRGLAVMGRNPLATRRPQNSASIEPEAYDDSPAERLPAAPSLRWNGTPETARLVQPQPGALSGSHGCRGTIVDGLVATAAAPAIPLIPTVHKAGFTGGTSTSTRLFSLPNNKLLARDSQRRPKDELDPVEPKGFVILSSARMRIRTGNDESRLGMGLGMLRRSMASLPAMGDLSKWGAGLVMVLAIGVYMFSGTPKASGKVTQARMISPSEPSAWSNIQKTILKRAAVALTDDFRGGLGDWTGNEGWGKSWSFDPTGFARSGSLALYSPSMGLSDYRFEFLGQIEKKALSWVVRAADLQNYQVVRLELSGGGPLPRGYIVRYPVIDGKKGSVTRTDLPMPVSTDTVYRVAMEVHGADHMLTVQGQVVDSWTEKRLRRGGIGFFSAPGEKARLRWVGVWHQYDALGRLCAYLVPRPADGVE